MLGGVFPQFSARRVRGPSLDRPLAEARHYGAAFPGRAWGVVTAAAIERGAPFFRTLRMFHSGCRIIFLNGQVHAALTALGISVSPAGVRSSRE